MNCHERLGFSMCVAAGVGALILLIAACARPPVAHEQLAPKSNPGAIVWKQEQEKRRK